MDINGDFKDQVGRCTWPGVQQVTEHTTLMDTSVEGQGGGYVMTNSN